MCLPRAMLGKRSQAVEKHTLRRPINLRHRIRSRSFLYTVQSKRVGRAAHVPSAPVFTNQGSPLIFLASSDSHSTEHHLKNKETNIQLIKRRNNQNTVFLCPNVPGSSPESTSLVDWTCTCCYFTKRRRRNPEATTAATTRPPAALRTPATRRQPSPQKERVRQAPRCRHPTGVTGQHDRAAPIRKMAWGAPVHRAKPNQVRSASAPQRAWASDLL